MMRPQKHRLFALKGPNMKAQYGEYVSCGTFVAILRSKARQLLAAFSDR